MRLLLVTVFFFLVGCSTTEKDETIGWPVQQLYFEAKSNMNSGAPKTARKYYNKLLARNPFGRYAQQANLDMILLEYKDEKYDAAFAQADKFLQMYPRSPYADYARYMKGVMAYSRDVSIFDRIMPDNISQSDQSMIQKAFENFQILVAQSPESEYAEDAKMRMRYLINTAADHEIYVAQYYLRRGAYLAAANRGKLVIEKYQSTPAVPLALAVMTRAYTELKTPKLAEDAKRILDKNFPNEAAKNERLNFILYGDITKKKGVFKRISENFFK